MVYKASFASILLMIITLSQAVLWGTPPLDGAAQGGQRFTFHVNAFDNSFLGQTLPNDSPYDVHAEILFNGQSFSPHVFTPYLFGAVGHIPASPGVYSVSLPLWDEWTPPSVTLDNLAQDQEVDFFGEYDGGGLPVELSSFTAVADLYGFVELQWVTQSESNLIGYYLLRNTIDELASALTICSLISATNTSNPATYSWTDEEVEAGNTYYYWLKAIDFNGGITYFGPISITLDPTAAEDELEPQAEESIRAIHPNPCFPGSGVRVELALKPGETGRISVCNLRGQTVRGYEADGSTSSLFWDGRDEQGKVCAPGVYFLRLNRGGMSQAKKLLLLR